MSNHILFRSISTVSLVLVLVSASSYFYAEYQGYHMYQIFLKGIPNLIMMFQVVSYFLIYKAHPYASYIGISLLLCTFGDIFLDFYTSNAPNSHYMFFVVGGICFVLARITMIVAFTKYPYCSSDSYKMIYNIKKTLILAFIILGLEIMLASYLFVFLYCRLIYLVLIYTIIMALQLFFSLIRVGGFIGESKKSQILAVFGTILFNLSDIMLFVNIFGEFRYAINIISLSAYWLGLYLITISIVRVKNDDFEKHGILLSFPYSL